MSSQRHDAWGLFLTVEMIGTLTLRLRDFPTGSLRYGFRASVPLLSFTHSFGLLFGCVAVALPRPAAACAPERSGRPR